MSAPPSSRPRVGVPYRTRKEELTPGSPHIGRYLNAVQNAGAESVAISLGLSREELARLVDTLNGIVLSGSPADLDPSLFRAERHPQTAAPDHDREKTDFALLEHCFAANKPLLAICYGIQSLNVFLGGTLVQDIPDRVSESVLHDWDDDVDPETFHTIQIEPGSRLARLAGSTEARVNSSHHQSILDPGRNLRVVARATEGVIEAVEWSDDTKRVMGVQWHPERMYETDALAQSLFRELVTSAGGTNAAAVAPAPRDQHSLSR